MMKDIATLLAAAEHLLASGDEGVLVTLVHTQGSTYRRPGARMLVLPGCRTVGTISGGCLESAVAKEAWARTRDAERACFTFESGPEDDTWGPASGCHGILYLLAERIEAGKRHAAMVKLAQVRAKQRPMMLAHFFARAQAAAGGDLVPAAVRDDARWQGEERIAMANATSRWVTHESVSAFLEYLSPPAHLLICGAGDDAQPLVRIAAEMAWSVDILDTRARLATRERFPSASGVTAGAAEKIGSLVHPHSAVVLMSHRFADDVAFLGELLAVDPSLAYVGLLGPRRRANRMLEELAARGIRPTARQASALRTPIGLDLGSNSPETIALSIIAEIQAAMAGRDAHPLSSRVGSIHSVGENLPMPPAVSGGAGQCAL